MDSHPDHHHQAAERLLLLLAVAADHPGDSHLREGFRTERPRLQASAAAEADPLSLSVVGVSQAAEPLLAHLALPKTPLGPMEGANPAETHHRGSEPLNPAHQ